MSFVINSIHNIIPLHYASQLGEDTSNFMEWYCNINHPFLLPLEDLIEEGAPYANVPIAPHLWDLKLVNL